VFFLSGMACVAAPQGVLLLRLSLGDFTYFRRPSELYPSTVPPGVKDVFVWLTGTPAPSDFCFSITQQTIQTK